MDEKFELRLFCFWIRFYMSLIGWFDPSKYKVGLLFALLLIYCRIFCRRLLSRLLSSFITFRFGFVGFVFLWFFGSRDRIGLICFPFGFFCWSSLRCSSFWVLSVVLSLCVLDRRWLVSSFMKDFLAVVSLLITKANFSHCLVIKSLLS